MNLKTMLIVQTMSSTRSIILKTNLIFQNTLIIMFNQARQDNKPDKSILVVQTTSEMESYFKGKTTKDQLMLKDQS